MTSISVAKLLFTRFENYIAGVFHPIPEERIVARAIQSFYGWVFPFLRNAFICGVLQYLADASGEHDATDIGDHRLCCARGLLLLVHHCRSADTISLCEVQTTRSVARWTGHTRRSLMPGVCDLGRNTVRYR